MDRYQSTIDPEVSVDSIKTMRQQNIEDALFERTMEVHQFLARWAYEASISFHAIIHDSLATFMRP